MKWNIVIGIKKTPTLVILTKTSDSSFRLQLNETPAKNNQTTIENDIRRKDLLAGLSLFCP